MPETEEQVLRDVDSDEPLLAYEIRQLRRFLHAWQDNEKGGKDLIFMREESLRALFISVRMAQEMVSNQNIVPIIDPRRVPTL